MAVRVYLVRHAKAEGDAPGGDAARRLTPEGVAAFAALAGSLGARARIRRIVTSPFARARETAELLARATGAAVELDPRLASGRSRGAEVIRLAAAAGDGAAVVGHNPELSEAVALAAGAQERVRPGTVAAVDVEPDGAGARLAWLERP